jgi:hypothetical protein
VVVFVFVFVFVVRIVVACILVGFVIIIVVIIVVFVLVFVFSDGYMGAVVVVVMFVSRGSRGKAEGSGTRVADAAEEDRASATAITVHSMS